MKRIIFLLLGILTISVLIAEDIRVQAYVDKNNVSVDEEFTLTIEVSGASAEDVSEPILPNIPFKNLGSNSGVSQSISIINGRVKKESKISFSFMLVPINSGVFSIPPVKVIIKNKSVYTKKLAITVNQGNNKASRQNSADEFQFKTNANLTKDDVFIKVIASKTSVYKNEPFVVRYRLYTRYQPSNPRFRKDINFSGFWKENLLTSDDLTGFATTLNGKKYLAYDLEVISLTPTRSGSLQIPSMEFGLDVALPARSIFSWDTTKSLILTSTAVPVTVRDIPVSNDSTYTGAVGQFSVSSSVNLHKLKAGESFTYSLKINGKGNLKLFSNPVFPEINNLKVLDPESDVEMKDSKEVVEGERIFRYPCIPQEEGLYVIPALKFTFFNPSTGRYESKMTQEIKIEVEKGNIILNSDNSQSGIKKEGNDIGFIATNMNMESYQINFKTFWYWSLIILLILSVPIHYLYRMEQEKLAANIEYLRNRTARKVLKKYLKEAFNAYHHHQINEFYDASLKGLSLFICDKLNIPRGSTLQEITDIFKSKNLNPVLTANIINFMNRCSQVKYMPGDSGSESFKNDYHYLKDLVNQLTKIMK